MPEHGPKGPGVKQKPHVIDERFCRDVNIEEYLENLFRVFPRVSSTEVQLLMIDRYETWFGIHNHDDDLLSKNKPLALVAVKEAEDSKFYDLRAIKRRAYIDSNVYKYTGIPMHEFFELTTEEVDEILLDCLERNSKDSRDIEAERAKLDAILKQNGGKN